jgi:hypothetical protein
MNKKIVFLSIICAFLLTGILMVVMQGPLQKEESLPTTATETTRTTDDAVFQHADNLCFSNLTTQEIRDYMDNFETEELDPKNWRITIKNSSYFESAKILLTDKACFFDVLPVLVTGASTAPLLDYQGYRDKFQDYYEATYDKENSDKYTGEYYKFKKDGKQYYAIFNYDTFNSALSLTITDDPKLYV